jgi:hypothetical protein
MDNPLWYIDEATPFTQEMWEQLMKQFKPKLQPNRSNFGLALYLYRHGFRWSEKRRGYIRLLSLTPDVVNISLVPEHCPYYKDSAHGRTRSAIHFAWWEVEDGDELLDNIPDLKHIRRVKQPISFNVNAETGERV